MHSSPPDQPQEGSFLAKLNALRFSARDLSPLARRALDQEAHKLRQRDVMIAWVSPLDHGHWEDQLLDAWHVQEFCQVRELLPVRHPQAQPRMWSNGARVERFRTAHLEGTGLTHHGYAAKAPWLTTPQEAECANQDTFLLMPKEGVFVVADGVGGSDAGAFASHRLVEEIAAQSGALIDGVESANRFLTHLSVSAQTTMAGVEITPDGELYPLWVGDSRILVMDPEGNLRFRSQDHGLPSMLANKEHQEDLDYPERHVISQCVGHSHAGMKTSLDTNPHDFFVQLTPGDTVMLLTDGVTDSMNSYEVAAFVRGLDVSSPDHRAERLGREIHERMMRLQFEEYGQLGGPKAKKLDNFTIVMLRYLG